MIIIKDDIIEHYCNGQIQSFVEEEIEVKYGLYKITSN